MGARRVFGGSRGDASGTLRIISRQSRQTDPRNNSDKGPHLGEKTLTLLVEANQVVAPGELLADGDHLLGDNAYRIGTQIFSACVGLFEVDGNRVTVVPLKGGYIPRVGDLVAGRIIDIGLSGWTVDIRSPYPAMLPASETPGPRGPRRRDLSTTYEVGDTVLAEVLAFDRTRDPLLTVKGPGLGKVASGRVVEISAAKIPRLIGRKGSM